jgi:hypothetical protein
MAASMPSTFTTLMVGPKTSSWNSRMPGSTPVHTVGQP